jgi:hypothetical protein
MTIDNSRALQSAQSDYEDPPIDEEYFELVGALTEEETFETVYEESDNPNWSSNLSAIPFDTEIVVAWNFTNSTHTKTLVIRKETEPSTLWFDNLDECINLSDARYWISFPELPSE